MTVPSLVFFSFLPLILWVAYCIYSRLYAPLSALGAVFLGLAAVVVASVIQALLIPLSARLSGATGVLFSAFVESALVEEFAKVCAVSFLPGFRKGRLSFRRILAGALIVGLSFSAFETVAYAIRAPGFPWFRYLTALPVHASTAIAGGAAISARRFPEYARRAGAFFGVAILLHGLFNACMEIGVAFLLLGFLCLPTLIALAIVLWNRSGRDRDDDERNPE